MIDKLGGAMRARSNRGRSGFTLIELVVVVLIILILVVVLLVALLVARSRAKKSTTVEAMNAIQTAMGAWNSGVGTPVGSFPSSGPKFDNSGIAKYDGMRRLFQELYAKPKAAGKAPYVQIREELVGYLSSTGEVTLTGNLSEGVFLDGWGTPMVYFEWKSLSDRNAGPSSDIPGAKASTSPVKLPAWVERADSFDLLSAGPDQEWGTEDDLSITGKSQRTAMQK